MSLYQLNSQNFQLVPSQGQRPSMHVSHGGLLLVFFKTQTCKVCPIFEPLFFRLQEEDKRVNYGILDLTYNNEVVKWSRDSTTAIQTVPALILYANGKPHARFTGDRNLASIKAFVTEALKLIGQQQQQPRYQNPPQQTQFVNTGIGSGVNSNTGGNMYGGNSHQQSFQPQVQALPQQVNRMGRDSPIGSAVHPSMQQQCDPDTESCIMVPKTIIPHNMPWESDFQKYAFQGRI